MRTFLLIVAVSLASSANVKREAAPDAEATAEADASADPGYARHHGHAGVTLLTETCPPSTIMFLQATHRLLCAR